MANNYVEASFAFKLNSPKEIEWWKKELARMKAEGDLPSDEMDPMGSDHWVLSEADSEVLFSHDECIDVEAAADVIHRFLKECEVKEHVGFTWAETCSKAHLDAFGGGACFITAEQIEWNSAYMWLEEQRKNHAQ